MTYPDRHGQVENGMIVFDADGFTFPNPFNDPIIKRLNECYAHEDHDYEVMFSDERWAHYERYCKAHLEDYLRWTWEHREDEK